MSDAETGDGKHQVEIPGWKVFMFQLFTILSYANSAVNPLLYVFVNENFRQNCIAAVSWRSRSHQPPVIQVTPTAAVRPRCGMLVRRPPATDPVPCVAIELQTSANDNRAANAQVTAVEKSLMNQLH